MAKKINPIRNWRGVFDPAPVGRVNPVRSPVHNHTASRLSRLTSNGANPAAGGRGISNGIKYYAYILPGWAKGKITSDWEACRREVSGVRDARYKSFETPSAAGAWLGAGAIYPVRNAGMISNGMNATAVKRPPRKKTVIQPGIYFDAGTGAGDGVRVRATDELGKDLLPESKKHLGRSVTNNYGELLALRYALEIALKKKVKNIWGDSRLIIDYWSLGFVKKDVAAHTVTLAREVAVLRKKFEAGGGVIGRIPGGDNPADLGFHRG